MFLLDEIDAYLHPNWQREFTEWIGQIDMLGQVLFTTHSPTTLGKMDKEGILILKDGKVFSLSDNIETYNTDISIILETIMGVTMRPIEVEDKIREFRSFIAKKESGNAEQVLKELKKLLREKDPFFVTAELDLKFSRR